MQTREAVNANMQRLVPVNMRKSRCFNQCIQLFGNGFLFLLQDARFNREVDVQTGYRTKALLCMPIKDASGDVIGVAQVINKLGGEQCFTANDEKVSVRFDSVSCKARKICF